jgi:hypothetical protein
MLFGSALDAWTLAPPTLAPTFARVVRCIAVAAPLPTLTIIA